MTNLGPSGTGKHAAGRSSRYDIVIVGGRVAGAAAAIRLSRHGYRILLVERAAMPSDTLSTHFLWPDGVAALDRLGVLDEVLAAGTPEVRHFQSWDGQDRLVADLVEIDGVDFGLCPRRTLLDGILFERAAASPGVDVLDRARVTRLLRDGERACPERGRGVTGIEVMRGGERREIEAGFVIGADGRNSLVAREVGAKACNATPAGRYWYYAYFRGASAPEPADSFIVSSAETDFIGSTRTNDGLQMVLYGAYDDDFEEFRQDHRANYLERVIGHPVGELMLAEAELASTVYGIAGVEGYYRRPSGPGWALVGDAVHQKDPIAGRGINDALRAAEWLADALADGVREAALESYARRLHEVTWPKYQLTRIVARPDRHRTDEQGALMAERIVTDAALTEFMRLWYDDRATFDEYFKVSS